MFFIGIDDSTVLSLNVLGRAVKPIPLLMNGIAKVPYIHME